MELSFTKGKGVLGKDGEPFAPNTMYVHRGEWLSPVPYSPESLVLSLMDKDVSSIEFIDAVNCKFVVTKS